VGGERNPKKKDHHLPWEDHGDLQDQLAELGDPPGQGGEGEDRSLRIGPRPEGEGEDRNLRTRQRLGHQDHPGGKNLRPGRLPEHLSWRCSRSQRHGRHQLRVEDPGVRGETISKGQCRRHTLGAPNFRHACDDFSRDRELRET